MSIKVAKIVWEFSQHRGNALVLLLAIADHAHDDGTGAWPSESRLAKMTRLSKRTVRRLLRVLERSGEISTLVGRGRGGTNLYAVTLIGRDEMAPQDGRPQTVPRTTGVAPRTPVSSPLGTRVSAEPSVEILKQPPRTRNKPRKNDFVPPEDDDVWFEMSDRGLGPTEAEEQAAAFIDHHETRGWILRGGTRMVDWKAAVGTWIRYMKQFSSGGNNGTGKQTASPAQQRAQRTDEASRRFLERTHPVDESLEPRAGPGTEREETRRLRAHVEPHSPH
ncbi:MAG: helix-turn-helix domain-containing protein [Acidobacteriia bacterium]|nr:helix-turn-helix domain-containing protein [Terriglobia bacterium]